MTIEPARLAETVVRQTASIDASITMFWYEIPSGRGVFATQLREQFSNLAAVVFELKANDLFANANALQSDVTRVISECRSEIENIGPSIQKLAIVVLSKSKFHLPLVSSPADLPDWYPELGGTCVNVPIVDLSWSADGNLKSPEVDSNAISTLLYDFNSVACALLKREHSVNPQSGSAFIQAINEFSDLQKKSFKFTMSAFVECVEESQSKLNRIGYRPSARNIDSIVAVLMRFASGSTPDNIHKKSIAFGRALGITDAAFAKELPRNLLATLFRPTNPSPDAVGACMREILVTVFFASQLTTASAHADSYGVFSLQLLSSISNHLVELLSAIVGSFEDLAASANTAVVSREPSLED